MKKIQLHGKYFYLFALVDNEDFKEVSQWRWYGLKTNSGIYAYTYCWYNSKRIALLMHRLILSLEIGSKMEGDHKGGNRLNNQRNNLRICNHQQNMFNMKSTAKSLSKYKGVSWNKNAKKWMAYIQYNNKLTNLGYYQNEIEAAKIYNKAAEKLFGEFASLNIVV